MGFNKLFLLISRQAVKQLLLGMSLWSSMAMADSLLGTLPNFLVEGSPLTMDDVILGRTCFSVAAGPQGLSCNPAFLATETKRQFRFNLYADEDVEDVANAYFDLKNKKDDLHSIEKLLTQKEPVIARTFAAFWYQHDWWATSFTPQRLALASRVKNPEAPEMAAHFKREAEVALRGGWMLAADPNLRVGLQTRYVSTRFFRKEFLFADLWGNPDLVQISSHDALMLEPGIVYAFAEDPWQPTLSLAVTNWQVYHRGDPQANTLPQGEIGFSSRPAFAKGRLATVSHLTLQPDVPDVYRRLRFGVIYDATFAHLTASLAYDEWGLGVSTAIKALTLGFGYKTEAYGWRAYMAELGLKF